MELSDGILFSTTGCKESQFYSLPFRQAEANMYYSTSHFNYM